MSSRGNSRLLDVQQAPIFRPTAQEFLDPLAYIKSIRHIGISAGIVKIIPPPGFKPPFCLDTAKLKFNTRLQQLNTLEGTMRNAKNYANSLEIFHQQFGEDFTHPVLEGNLVNLLNLRNICKSSVTNARIHWTKVSELMNMKPESSSKLREIYQKFIVPYESVLNGASTKHVKIIPNDESSFCSSVTISSDEDSSPAKKRSRLNEFSSPLKRDIIIISDDDSEYAAPKQKKQKPDKLTHSEVTIIAQEDSKRKSFMRKIATFGNAIDGGSPTKSPKNSRMMRKGMKFKIVMAHQKLEQIPEDSKFDGIIDWKCQICNKIGSESDSVVCTQCDLASHLKCITPALKTIPKDGWTCVKCIKSFGADYGFEEYKHKRSWDEFKNVAHEFKKNWCKTRNINFDSSEAIEKEFWRLVESPLREN